MENELTIFVTLYNRLTYSLQSISSLHEQVKNRVKIIFIDDSSAEENNRLVKSHINEIGLENFEYYINERNLGIERSIFFIPYFSDTKLLYITDNDVLYSNSFYTQLFNGVKMVSNTSNAIISLFNAGHKETGNVFNGYKEKINLGGISMLTKTETLFNALKYAVKNGYCDSRKTSWDFGVSKYCKDNHGLLLSTEKSYIQHIGETGLHSRPEIPGSYVFAENFTK